MEKIPTRIAYGQALAELGEENDRVVVIDADISKITGTHFFARKFPERFFNVGIAEQNEMGIAAGMATTGKIVFASTYAVFASMRACEQVRTFIAHTRSNVKIAASHGGLTGTTDGVTHQGTEDMGIMRTIPDMTIIMPADAIATRKIVRELAEHQGPAYLRLTKIPMPIIYDEETDIQIGRAVQLRDGDDVTIIAIGDMVIRALEAADLLDNNGIRARVLDMHTLKPVDKGAVIKAAEQTGAIVTVEDHNILNGLGSAVAEVIVENRPVPMERIGLRDTFAESGEYEELLEKYGLNTRHITEAARKAMGRKL
ncbi:MAG: transketolase family protein [Desulfobacterales bacterium]|nr:transketolase family protein [Desulfobacterales bacterium]